MCAVICVIIVVFIFANITVTRVDPSGRVKLIRIDRFTQMSSVFEKTTGSFNFFQAQNGLVFICDKK